VWIGIASLIGLATAATGLVLRGTGPAVQGTLEAFAAGGIPGPGLGHDDPSGIPRLAAVQRPAGTVVGFVSLLIVQVLSY